MHHVEVDVARSGQIIGRFTLLQLRKSVESGTIRPDDHYFDTKTQSWVELAENSFLKGEFQRVAQEAKSKKLKTYLTLAIGIGASIALAMAALKGLSSSHDDATGRLSSTREATGEGAETSKLDQIERPTTPQATNQSQSGSMPAAMPSERLIEAEAFGRYGNEIFHRSYSRWQT